MMVFYNLGIRLYGAVLFIAHFFNSKAKKWVKGRENFYHHLIAPKQPVIWFHCASLGEFEQGRPIIEEWRKKFPEDYILLTFFSPSGYEVRKDYPIVNTVCYLPLDTPQNAEEFIAHFKPAKAFFIKYEFWLNYIKQCSKNNVDLYSISGLFNQNQRFFKWYGSNFRKALRQFEHFFVQDERSKSLLQNINIEQVTVSGDTRYDRVFEHAQNVTSIPIIENWLGKEKAFIIGSSWEKDEALLAHLLNENFNGKVIIAPHEVNSAHIQFIQSTFYNLKQARYTTSIHLPADTQLLIIDCVGILSSVYQYGEIAYIGGAFNKGLHNILEPAIFGLPVIFGANYHKFPEAKLFIEQGIGYAIKSDLELVNKYQHILSNLSELQSKTKSFTENQRGAKDIIFDTLNKK